MLKIILGDCLEKLQDIEDNSVDSIVTDPPYGLSFMGKRWDYDVPTVAIWEQCLRVLKPGGHLLAFAGTRTQHRMAVRIEDAGFEIRDMIAWVYGSGFSKGFNLSRVESCECGANPSVQQPQGTLDAGTLQGRGQCERCGKLKSQFKGWSSNLKPALEPITVARKPMCGTVAENVLQHGTGGLNVDGCRVATDDTYTASGMKSLGVMHDDNWQPKKIVQQMHAQGRWPANLIHDGSDEVVGLFPKTSSGKMKAGTQRSNTSGWAGPMPEQTGAETYGDSGSAARFFYCAKASKKDREETNKHPTVKPTDLMRYLIRLVTPPKGLVLDPFMGSGSTGKACVLEKMNFIGIELNKDYYLEARKRIVAAKG